MKGGCFLLPLIRCALAAAGLISISAWAGSWCTTVSYSAAFSSGMNRTFGTATHAGSQGQQCFATQMACESARQSANYGVSTTPCAQQGGSSGTQGWSPGSSDSPMSSENYRPNFTPEEGQNYAPAGGMSSEQPAAPLVNAQRINLPQPWEPPPTCVGRYAWMSDHYDQLLARRKAAQEKLDVHAVNCSGIEADSLVMAICNKESKTMQPEIDRYDEAIDAQQAKDRVLCDRYMSKISTSPGADRKWRSGLACALTDIYARSQSMGVPAAQFADQLRQDVEGAQFSSLPSDQEAVVISDASESTMFSLHKSSPSMQENSSQQIAVNVLVSRHVNDGSVIIQADSALLDGSSQRTNEQTTLLVYDRAGNLIGGNYSPAVHRCLSRSLTTAGN